MADQQDGAGDIVQRLATVTAERDAARLELQAERGTIRQLNADIALAREGGGSHASPLGCVRALDVALKSAGVQITRAAVEPNPFEGGAPTYMAALWRDKGAGVKELSANGPDLLGALEHVIDLATRLGWFEAR